ncbi:MAG TPA: hypothetical protein QF564_02070 [Pirellulaceae bacterium]|nr:hypothetical protein [Pirellulaceae bacterium]
MLTRIGCWWSSLCLIAGVVVFVAGRADAEGPLPPNAAATRERAEARSDVTMDTVQQKLTLAWKSLEYVKKREPRPKLAAELQAMTRTINRTGDGTDLRALLQQVSRLRRKIILSHPDLAFDKLLINLKSTPRISHMVDQHLGQHQPTGKGLATLENWKTNPRLTILLDGKMPPGAYEHPDVSFDGTRILFAFSDHRETALRLRRFWIWECASDGSWAKQLTGTKNDLLQSWDDRQTVLIEDWDPCYLPGGGFVFISTRCQTYGRCHGTRYAPVYLLHGADADGSNIRQLSFGEANEWNPSVLNDGRVVYTRWDYINRHDTLLQGLWTTRPDGTDTRHFFGTNTRAPTMLAEAHAIPGSHRIITTAAAHHRYTTGSFVMVDPLSGEDGERPIRRITPEAAWPEAEGYGQPGSFCAPWPVNEEMYFAAYQPDVISRGRRDPDQQGNIYAIYLVDSLGGRELIYRDLEHSCVSPIPLRPRPEPPAIASKLPTDGKTKDEGILFIQDANVGIGNFKAGTVKSIRVNQIYGQPTNVKLNPGIAINEIIKQILGTVPVNDDGSVMVKVPARQPLQLQALDENGMALMTMRSVIYVQPGETQSCVGCHESKTMSPPNHDLPSASHAVDLTLPPGPQYSGGFSFVRTVQPVLDRYCISCHGLEKTEGEIDLLGTPRMVSVPQQPRGTSTPVWSRREVFANQAVASLLSRTRFEEGLVNVALRFGETDVSQPKDYFAHAGKLASMLLQGHEGVKLDNDSFQRIIGWLDLNAQISGSYLPNQPELRTPVAEQELALREHVGERFGQELASQPLAALINYAVASESRILKAPLAASAGGWGQINDGWNSTDDPRYRKMLELVDAVLPPLQHHDIAGTCGRTECVCGACWVRQAKADYITNSRNQSH